MGVCYPSKVIEFAKSKIGYKEGSNNWNEFAKELDSVNYFNPQKKQNVPWCCVFVDDSVYNGSGKDKAKTYDVLYQPSYENLSAVVSYMAGYFKKKSKYFTDKDTVEKGDIVFFNSVNDKGQVTSTFSHVGIVVDRDDRGITTVEGNKGDMVKQCQYLFTSIGTKINGFGKPKYDKEPSPEKEVNIVVKVTAPEGVKVNIKVEN